MSFDPFFSGYLPPPSIPNDPSGQEWRGIPGPPGSTGPAGPPGDPTGPVIATGSTTPRISADRFADLVNVKDFGAVVDGVSLDTASVDAARSVAPAGATIYVPPGGWNASAPTSGSAAGNVLWHLSGNHFGTGSTPVTSLGATNFDLIETYLTGTSGVKYWGKNFPLNAGPALRLDVGLTQVGGTEGHVTTGLQINPTQGLGSVDSVWGIVVNYQQNANRDAGGTGLWPQCLPIAINMFKNASAQSWGMGIYLDDSQGISSATGGGMNGIEMGILCNGDDDSITGGSRRFFDLIAGTHGGAGTRGQLGNGILMRGNTSANIVNGFHVLNSVTNGFVAAATLATAFQVTGTGVKGLDTTTATLSDHAVHLGNNQTIGFGTSAGTAIYSVYYNTTGALWTIAHTGGADLVTLTTAGALNALASYSVAGTKVVGTQDTGWVAMTGTPDESTAFATSTVTLAQLAGRVMALQTALTTHGLLGP